MFSRTGYYRPVLLCAWIFSAVAGPVVLNAETAITHVWPADMIFREGVISNLRMDSEGGVILGDHVLVEDDAPGAGVSQNADGSDIRSYDEVSARLWIKKELYLDDVRASTATLVLYGREPSTGVWGEPSEPSLQVLINGHLTTINSIRRKLPSPYQSWNRPYWYYLDFPPSFLLAGTNTFVFRTENTNGPWRVFLSEYRNYASGSETPARLPAYRSSRRRDGAMTWQTNPLGVDANLEGEYVVRLRLGRHVRAGSLTTPVVDLLSESGSTNVIRKNGIVRSVLIRPTGAMPKATGMSMEARSGTTLQPAPATWDEWKSISEAPMSVRGRYLQCRFHLTTDNPLASPVLRQWNIRVEAEVLPAANGSRIQTLGSHNETILRGSYAFASEPYDHPRLIELRRRYELDQVVAGATNEFEKILRLKNWTAQHQFKRKPGTRFPPWDAVTILDGRGWFCLQYAIVFMQSCLALGIPCRHIAMNPLCDSGHEVAEVWSNDHKKWIFIDPQYNYYVRDKTCGVPLSLQEFQRLLSQRQKKDLLVPLLDGQPPVPAVVAPEGDIPYEVVVALCPLNPPAPPAGFRSRRYGKGCFFMRMIPRNNFLDAKAPLPLNHGTSHWPWDGYLNWCDDHTPALPQYSRYVHKKEDFYWTLNQTYYEIIAGPVPGTVTVQLDTVTPDFKTFLARKDDGAWEPVSSVYSWVLHEGTNNLEFCTRNRAGSMGIKSGVSLLLVSPK